MSTQTVYSPQSAGKTVKTRWGNATFDARGKASIDIPDADLDLFSQLGWFTDPEAAREAEMKALKEREAAKAAASVPPTGSLAEVTVQCAKSAGQTVKSRWGTVSFGTDGITVLKLPEDDISLLAQLGWQVLASSAGAPKSDSKKTAASDEITKDEKKVLKVGKKSES